LKNNKRLYRNLFAILVSLSILLFLISRIEYQNISLIVKKANFSYLLLAWFIYLIGNAIKTLRFGFLFKKKRPNFTKLYLITSLYNLFTSIFPTGTGEISYPLLLKKFDGQPMGIGAGSLILVRMYDFCLFLAMFLISGAAIIKLDFGIKYAWIFLILAISVVTLFNLKRLSAFFFPKFIYLLKKFKFDLHSRASSVFADITDFFTQKDHFIIHLCLSIHTLFIWLSSLLFFFYAFMAFSSPISLFHAMFIASAMNLTVLLPIATIGGFGIKEAALAGLLIVTGLFDYKSAITLGIMVRLVSFVANFVLLGFAYLFFLVFPKDLKHKE